MKRSLCVLIILFLSAFTESIPALRSRRSSEISAAPAAPVQLTINPRYDRNPNLLKTADGKFWLFFTRGRNPIGVRGVSGYDPDSDSYDIYFKTAGTVAGLKKAAEYLVPASNLVTINTQRDIAAVQAADKSIWLFASSGYGASSDQSIFTYRYTKATGWTGPTAIAGTSVAGHIDALAVGGIIWLFYENWPYSLKVMFWNGAGWSSPVTILEKATLPKAVFEGGRFYLVWAYVDMDLGEYGKYIGLSTSTNGTDWTTIGQIAAWPGATNWDPALIKYAGTKTFNLYWAPDTGSGGQVIAARTSKMPLVPGSWSTMKQVTTASNGAESWWDFWPNPGKTPRCLFYSSERNPSGTAMADGNIWMIWQ
jgi:hypothetical protein